MSLNNNTTSGDNSSDSASNKKNLSRSELELVEQKIKKCHNEIENLKKKVQREWSIQMNNHLKSFYPDEEKNKSELFSTPGSQSNHQHDSPADIEKTIHLLTKKLHSYERRKQKLLVVQAKSQNPDADLVEPLNDTNSINTTSLSQTDSLANAPNSNSTNPNGLLAVNQENGTITNNLSVNNIANPAYLSSQRNMSFNNGRLDVLPNPIELSSSLNEEKTSHFYLNQENCIPGVGFSTANQKLLLKPQSFNNNYNNANSTYNSTMDASNPYLNNEEYLTSNATLLAINKSLQNLINLQTDQITNLISQQEKIQFDLEDIQKKMDENQQSVMKEIHHSYNQISEPIHKLSFNLYKSYDQKLDDFKSVSLTSMQSLGYNLTHYQRDIQEIKGDVIFMKNRVELVEKTQKAYNVESNPTNYYHLFYKLLDIFLTLATIILLAVTNLVASIKFIFLLYPRTIVIFLFFYFVFFYIVDHDKLINLFDALFSDSRYTRLQEPVGDSGDAVYLKQSFFKRTMQALYGLVFRFEST